MPTRKEMIEIAATQSAIELGCDAKDFFRDGHVIVSPVVSKAARHYLQLPFDCQLVSYGNNIVASVRDDLRASVERYLSETDKAHCFETPAIHTLDKLLAPFGLQTYYMAEYFLPDPAVIPELECSYTVRILEQNELGDYYTAEWSNALCKARKADDRLAAIAFDGDRPVGMAGCSADCQTMWQIGVDVLPPYRRKGIAAALTAWLTREIFARGKVPFYCAAWCNLASVGNALRSGFRPAWVELTAKPIE